MIGDGSTSTAEIDLQRQAEPLSLNGAENRNDEMAVVLQNGCTNENTANGENRDAILLDSLCRLYGIFIITLGALITISDPFFGKYNNGTTIYTLILCLMGITYLLYLFIDIWIEEVREKRAKRDRLARIDRHYTFDLSKHASNSYLKIGAAGFALGHLVHYVLLLVIHNVALDDKCSHSVAVGADAVYIVYSLLQLAFIFKYNNIVILERKVIASFGFMHFIGSSVTFWIWTIVRETWLALFSYQYEKTKMSNATNVSLTSQINDVSDACYGFISSVEVIFVNLSPYLFPFSVEFNIVMGGFFLIIWLKISKTSHYTDRSVHQETIELTSLDSSVDSLEGSPSKFVIHADCHSSSRGLLAGFSLLVVTVVNIVFGFVLQYVDYKNTPPSLIENSARLTLHLVMLVTVIAAFYRTRSLTYSQLNISTVDDFLLLACTPGFVLYCTLTMVATADANIMLFIDALVDIVQVLIQTPFLIDRMRRCSNTRTLRRRKPGRQLVALLLVVNVAMWILYTFSYKPPMAEDERYVFYGKELWLILGHVNLPLMMFYRFHSSVCLADIWQLGYQSSDH